MQQIHAKTIPLTTGQVTPIETDPTQRATRITVEPKVGNAAASFVNETVSGSNGILRQFPAAAAPVTMPFSHKCDGNQIQVSNYGVSGATGDSMIVVWWNQ